MATGDRDLLFLLLAWGYFAAAARGEAPREVSFGAIRVWLESGSPLAAQRLARIPAAQRTAWLDETAAEAQDVLLRLCLNTPQAEGGGSLGGGDAVLDGGAAALRGIGGHAGCFFAMPIGPDPYRAECVRCLWPRIGRCGGRAA
jgi:hypothetical protein